jgi:hypothetical protein
MNKKQFLIEKELHFTFPGNLDVKKFDSGGRRTPQGMSFVDIIIKNKTQIYLVEIKDPSHSMAPISERKKFEDKIKNDSLIREELVPKARDSYTFLHLMKEDDKEFIYIVLLGLDAIKHEKALLINFKDKLIERILKETDRAWKRAYIRDCVVLTVDDWVNYFPDWPITRLVPAGGTNVTA